MQKYSLITAVRFLFFKCILCLLLITSCGKDIRSEDPSLIEIVEQGNSELFSIPLDRYHQNLRDLPIGVFDSGIGGLTVLAEIMRIDEFCNDTYEPGPDGRPDFESERFIYLGDHANMPYGDYPAANKEDFLRELILKNAIFLLGTRYWQTAEAPLPAHDKPPVKAVVIACNTATAYGLEQIREAFGRWDIPVYLIGVVEAGARGVTLEDTSGLEKNAVAVLATVGTCRSEVYVRAVEDFFSESGLKPPSVIQQGCHGLASAIEGDPNYVLNHEMEHPAEYHGPSFESTEAPLDTALVSVYKFEPSGIIGDIDDPLTWRLNSVENYIRYHVATLVENYRKTDSNQPIGTVILGCTHFPYETERIEAAFNRLRNHKASDGSYPYRELITEDIAFVDPAILTARELFTGLAESGLLVGNGESPVIQTDEFYISVPNTAVKDAELTETGSFTYAYKYGRETGKFDLEYVKRVPMDSSNISLESRNNIHETMPWLWDRMVRFSIESPRTVEIPQTARLVLYE